MKPDQHLKFKFCKSLKTIRNEFKHLGSKLKTQNFKYQ